MKLLKLLGGLFVGLLLLLIGGVLVLSWVINPNDYKPQLQALVQAETGRTLELEGDIEWSLFPALGLDLGRVTLSNADNFAEPHFATAEQAIVRLEVLPLLGRVLSLETVQLIGVKLWLARNTEGQTNWDDLAALGQKEPSPESAPKKDSELPFKTLKLQGFVLKDAYIQWDDAQAQNHYRLSAVNLTTGAIQYPVTRPIPLNLTGQAESVSASPLQAEFALDTQVNFAAPDQQYGLKAFALTLTVDNAQLPQGRQTLRLSSPRLHADLQANTLEAEAFSVQLGDDIRLNSELHITQLTSDPVLSGRLALAEFNPRQVLAQWAIALPDNLPEPLLKRAALSTELNANAQKGVFLTDVQLSIDEGRLQIPRLQFDLATQALTIETWSLDGMGIQGQGALALTQLFSNAPHIAADLALTAMPAVLLQQFQPDLANALPPALRLEQAAFNVVVEGTSETLQIPKLQLQIDEHQLTTAHVTLQPQQAGLSVQALQLQAFGVSASANLAITSNATGNGELQGTLAVKPFNLRHLAETLQLPLPPMQDPTTLTHVALNTTVTGRVTAPALEQLNLVLDDSRLQGSVQLPALSPPRVKFALTLNELNLDRYLPPKSEKTAESPSPNEEDTAQAPLPVEQLQQLDLDGTLNIGQLTTAGAKMKDLALILTAKKGEISLSNQLNLYQGALEGSVKLYANQTPPRVTLIEQLKNVTLEPLLQDVTQVALLAGQTNAQLNLSADFSDATQLLETLSGTIALDLVDGAINGFNLGRSLRQAKALLKGEPQPPPEPLKSDFSSLQIVFKARNGILHTEQLSMESPLLRVQGSGQIDLPAQTMDLRLETMVVNTSTGQEGKQLEELSGIGIPILLTGDLQQPSVQPDLKVLVSLGSFGLDLLKEQFGSEDPATESEPQAESSTDPKSDIKQEALQEIGKRLGDKLKGLF